MSGFISELPTISKILFVVFVAFLMQGLGGYFQIKNYRETIHRMHKLGNVGIGQKKGKFFNGNIVMVASDGEGKIVAAEILDGVSFLAKFHPVNEFLGREVVGQSIHSFLQETDEFDKKQRKRYQGWIRALEALRMRFEEGEGL